MGKNENDSRITQQVVSLKSLRELKKNIRVTVANVYTLHTLYLPFVEICFPGWIFSVGSLSVAMESAELGVVT